MHELFKKRRSIRRYQPQVVSQEQLKEIVMAGMVAPSAKNLHPAEFLVVQDQVKLEKLARGGPWQGFIDQASVAIVVVSDFQKSPEFWLIDASIAAGYLYLEATNQGLATCWANIYQGQTEDGQDRETYVKEILGIPKEKRVICILPIGYPAEKKSPHSEKDFNPAWVHWENW